MKTIGLIGGMSWESTVTYYKVINKTINRELGHLHSAKCILYSVDFHEVEQCQIKGEWEKSAKILCDAALTLQKAGVDFIVICTNTMHKVVPSIQCHISIPIIHIAEPVTYLLKRQKINKVALLGTQYTMEQDFYKKFIMESGIDVIIPNLNDRKIINTVIFEELCLGKINLNSKQKFLDIINKLAIDGAEAVILGCTEIGLLIDQKDTDTPLLDTTVIHAEYAANQALGIDNTKIYKE